MLSCLKCCAKSTSVALITLLILFCIGIFTFSLVLLCINVDKYVGRERAISLPERAQFDKFVILNDTTEELEDLENQIDEYETVQLETISKPKIYFSSTTEAHESQNLITIAKTSEIPTNLTASPFQSTDFVDHNPLTTKPLLETTTKSENPATLINAKTESSNPSTVSIEKSTQIATEPSIPSTKLVESFTQTKSFDLSSESVSQNSLTTKAPFETTTKSEDSSTLVRSETESPIPFTESVIKTQIETESLKPPRRSEFLDMRKVSQSEILNEPGILRTTFGPIVTTPIPLSTTPLSFSITTHIPNQNYHESLLEEQWQQMEHMWSKSLSCKLSLVQTCESTQRDLILHQNSLDEQMREQFHKLMAAKDKGEFREHIDNLVQQAREHVRFHMNTRVDLCEFSQECQECVEGELERWMEIHNPCGRGYTRWLKLRHWRSKH